MFRDEHRVHPASPADALQDEDWFVLRIGDVTLSTNLLLSPIAGYCDLAFRLTVRSLGGVGLACTALVNPRGLLRRTAKSMELVETLPADRPLCMQLYGSQPDEMAAAARWCEAHGAAVVDINMGCPAETVCKRHGGAMLLRRPDEAVVLAKQVVAAVGIPVTVKMRLGWDIDAIGNNGTMVAPMLAAAMEDVGVAAIIVHGRSAKQKFSGSVSLDSITHVVETVRAIPVIGNGDVRSPTDAKHMIDRTGCAGVMIGRAALSDPWIFRDTHALLTRGVVPPTPTIGDRIEMMNQHFRHLLCLRGERLACHIFRQRISWYAGKLGPCRPLQDRLRLAWTAAEYWEAVDAFVATLGTSQRVGASTEQQVSEAC